MSSKIYTKTGDSGTTSLLGGTKVAKSHARIEAYGTVDELNSYIGLCKDLLQDVRGKQLLQEIQDRLFTIGAALACDPVKAPKMHIPDLKPEDVNVLETEIDAMTSEIKPMKSFILPGGHSTISHLHIARCICRRAERCCVRLEQVDTKPAPIVLQYLNRLSDYLFILARYTAHLLKIEDVPWKPR